MLVQLKNVNSKIITFSFIDTFKYYFRLFLSTLTFV